jgi:pimeloyl-ACP methyl ester carboxylesterase
MTDRAALVRNKGMTAVVSAILTNGLSEQTRKSNVLAQALVKSTLLGTKPEGYAQACLALAGAEDPDYSKIVAPTLIVAGDQDKTSPQATTDALTGAIAGSKAITLAGVGHWHFLEDVEGVAKAISSFL